jgi:transcriptional regulator with XRE-family HTH domain
MQPETTYYAILGRYLQKLRKDQGMDQFEIAKEMGMDRSSWSRIENGNTMVNIQQLQKIGEIFGCKVNEILHEVDGIADDLKREGYIVHYDSIKEIRSKSSGLQGLALVGGAALGLLVGHILHSKVGEKKSDKDE